MKMVSDYEYFDARSLLIKLKEKLSKTPVNTHNYLLENSQEFNGKYLWMIDGKMVRKVNIRCSTSGPKTYRPLAIDVYGRPIRVNWWERCLYSFDKNLLRAINKRANKVDWKSIGKVPQGEVSIDQDVLRLIRFYKIALMVYKTNMENEDV